MALVYPYSGVMRGLETIENMGCNGLSGLGHCVFLLGLVSGSLGLRVMGGYMVLYKSRVTVDLIHATRGMMRKLQESLREQSPSHGLS